MGAPHAAAQASALGWVDKVCTLAKEQERNVYNGPDFVVNVDTKWATHGAFTPPGADRLTEAAAAAALDAKGAVDAGDALPATASAEAAAAAHRRTWHGAAWTADLYLLAIAKDPKLTCAALHSNCIPTKETLSFGTLLCDFQMICCCQNAGACATCAA